MARPKKVKEEPTEILEQSSDVPEDGFEEIPEDLSQLTEKQKLLELYQTLKDLGVNSIGDLEVKIARLP